MNTKSKLLLIAPLPPPYGGITVMTKAFFSAGIENQFDLIHIDTSKKTNTEKIGKITTSQYKGNITFKDFSTALKTYAELIKVLLYAKQHRNSLVFATSNSGIIRDLFYVLLLNLFNRKVILFISGTRAIKKFNKIIQCCTRFALKFSDIILSPTQIDLNGLTDFFGELPRTFLFYNSTFIQKKYDKIISNNDTFKIIGIGRLSAAKGTFDLINACINLLNRGYNLELTWIGRGAYDSDDLKAREIIFSNPKYSGRIILLNDITEDVKISKLLVSDIFVLPSHNENLPLSILEAMAIGLPVISTNVGAIPEVIKDYENGWLVSPMNLEELESKILLAMEDRDSLISIGKKNQIAFYENFSTSIRLTELNNYVNNYL